ncbi:MAG TPA: GrpB family protein [Verrucomicrobiales bacterium]|jgi:GrpB-like predicted nucleotidyltransferase (UPF0157 family)|nr:GrpB family protein [Verrucomicrobiales bacterium]
MRVFLVPSDPRWPEEFAREASLLKDALGVHLLAIHHIGSTAIPGIDAKPVIDFLAVADDLARIDEQAGRVEALGYEAMGEFGIPGRRYFRKSDRSGDRTHQIHTFQAGSPQIERHLAFCAYLRAHPACAKEYEALKRRLAAQYPAGITSYSGGKDEFIKDVDAKAAAWRAQNRPEP